MFPRRLIFGALAILLVLGLFMGVSSTMQRDAWMQGYMMGRLSAGGDGGTGAALPPYFYPGFGGWGAGPHFGFFGLFLFLGLLFLLFVGLGRFLRFRGWRGPEGQPWGPHGHRPPWWGEEGAPESRPEQESPRSRASRGPDYV